MLQSTLRPRYGLPRIESPPSHVPAFHFAAPLRVRQQSPWSRLSLQAWLALPSPYRWLIRTIRLGYAIQFTWRPSKFRGVDFISVKTVDAHVLCAEIVVPLVKRLDRVVPPADMRSGFYSPNFLLPIRILNYLYNWIIFAHSREHLCKHRESVLSQFFRGSWGIWQQQ